MTVKGEVINVSVRQGPAKIAKTEQKIVYTSKLFNIRCTKHKG